MLTREEAAELTSAILATSAGRWDRVVAAWSGRAWEALGYRSWEEWCEGALGPQPLPLAAAQRYPVIARMRDAGMPFGDVEAVVVRGGRAPLPDGGPGRRSRIEDDLGLSDGELDLVAALLEVDDEEFGWVLATGQRRGDLSAGWVRQACWEVIRRRRNAERDLERAARALVRARELLARSETATASPAARKALRDIEDHAWELLDEIDVVQMGRGPDGLPAAPRTRPLRPGG